MGNRSSKAEGKWGLGVYSLLLSAARVPLLHCLLALCDAGIRKMVLERTLVQNISNFRDQNGVRLG